MSAVLSTLGSTFVAWSVATLLGLFVGYLSVVSPRGRTISLWLTEARGGMPASTILFVLAALLPIRSSLLLGMAVGVSQATSLARFMASTHAHWSDALIAEVLLGKRASFFFARSAAARGAVRGLSAAVPCYVLLWESLFVLLHGDSEPCLGGYLVSGTSEQAILGVLVVFGLTILAEWLGSAWFLGRVLVRKRAR